MTEKGHSKIVALEKSKFVYPDPRPQNLNQIDASAGYRQNDDWEE